jgi:hypothetical protein
MGASAGPEGRPEGHGAANVHGSLQDMQCWGCRSMPACAGGQYRQQASAQHAHKAWDQPVQPSPRALLEVDKHQRYIALEYALHDGVHANSNMP